MMREVLALLVLVGCEGKPSPTSDMNMSTETKPPSTFLVGGTEVTFKPVRPDVVASPEAYVHHKKTRVWELGTTAEFEKREAIKDGFAITVALTPPKGPPRREVHVVREIGRRWFQCHATITDDATRDEVVARCRAEKP